MEELLSYRLSDLLMFSEQSYLRQFELYNLWLSPTQWLTYLYGVIFLLSLVNPERFFTRVLFLASALFWLVCSIGFLWQFYAAINWMANTFIVLFIIQSLLILWAGFFIYSPGKQKAYLLSYRIGIMLWVSTLLLQPIIELLLGRDKGQLSAFALTPDSLSYMSVACILILRIPALIFIPAGLWLLFSTLTYLAMDSMAAFFPALALAIYFIFPAAKYFKKTESSVNIHK